MTDEQSPFRNPDPASGDVTDELRSETDPHEVERLLTDFYAD